MIPVIVEVHLQQEDGFHRLIRDTSMPFIPHKGMLLVEESSGQPDLEVEEVEYDLGNRIVTVYCRVNVMVSDVAMAFDGAVGWDAQWVSNDD